MWSWSWLRVGVCFDQGMMPAVVAGSPAAPKRCLMASLYSTPNTVQWVVAEMVVLVPLVAEGALALSLV